ncbi:Hypothetical_protein [Hexamita inflata]|uniref:Hypothetical_protein n=1 Tax=Hexamita inflata TaxID=28002 RepID=A0AA86N449_9EUKA|nr:Hypothetical protein HINF_LOCUS21 [Hexamita inflata]
MLTHEYAVICYFAGIGSCFKHSLLIHTNRIQYMLRYIQKYICNQFLTIWRKPLQFAVQSGRVGEITCFEVWQPLLICLKTAKYRVIDSTSVIFKRLTSRYQQLIVCMRLAKICAFGSIRYQRCIVAAKRKSTQTVRKISRSLFNVTWLVTKRT